MNAVTELLPAEPELAMVGIVAADTVSDPRDAQTGRPMMSWRINRLTGRPEICWVVPSRR